MGKNIFLFGSGLFIAGLIFSTFLLVRYYGQVQAKDGYSACVNDIVRNVNSVGYVQVPVTDENGKSGYYILKPSPSDEKNTEN